MDVKKLHTLEFQLKGIGRNTRCKLLQKRSTGKITECYKHMGHITIEKDIFHVVGISHVVVLADLTLVLSYKSVMSVEVVMKAVLSVLMVKR